MSRINLTEDARPYGRERNYLHSLEGNAVLSIPREVEGNFWAILSSIVYKTEFMEGTAMKQAIITMVIMFLVMVWPLGGLWEIILKPIIGGGAEQAFIYPLYIGIIILAGLVVGCTELIIKEIRSKDGN